MLLIGRVLPAFLDEGLDRPISHIAAGILAEVGCQSCEQSVDVDPFSL